MAYTSKSSHAIISTSADTFFIFFSHSRVLNHVNLGFSTHTYLETLETSVIGTNNLSLFLYSKLIYSLLIPFFCFHQILANSLVTISRKIPIQ